MPKSKLPVEIAVKLIHKDGKALALEDFRQSNDDMGYPDATTELAVTLGTLEYQPTFVAFVKEHKPTVVRIERSSRGHFEAVVRKGYIHLAIRLLSMEVIEVDARHPDQLLPRGHGGAIAHEVDATSPDGPSTDADGKSPRESIFVTAAYEAVEAHLQSSPDALAAVRAFAQSYDIGSVQINLREERFYGEMSLYAEMCCVGDNITLRRENGQWLVGWIRKSKNAEHLMSRLGRYAEVRALRVAQRDGRGCKAPKLSHHRSKPTAQQNWQFDVLVTCPTRKNEYTLSISIKPPGTRISHVTLGKPTFQRAWRRPKSIFNTALDRISPLN